MANFFNLGNDTIAAAKCQQAQFATIDHVGSATPMPTATSSTPAWDPSSRTPLDLPLRQSPPHYNANNSSSSRITDSVVPPRAEHILLHPLFENLKLHVIINGAETPIVANITMTNGYLTLRHVVRGTSSFLEPNSIQPRHPVPTHYNGLVIVIEGEHHGKYLRRLFHDGYKASALMIGAVVKRVEGCCDHITGEQIKISATSLCVVEESQAEVKRMKEIMLKARRVYKANLAI